jgi:hypothetical protein
MVNESSEMRVRSVKIVSGGQTGADRAALDEALSNGLAIGGWCPAGRRAEDGRIPPHYPLNETPSTDYAVRTAWNVRDSDATLIFCRGEPTGGTALTQRETRLYGKPLKIVDPRSFEPSEVRDWIIEHRVARLNVAGPRESEEPGIYVDVRRAMLRLISTVRG